MKQIIAIGGAPIEMLYSMIESRKVRPEEPSNDLQVAHGFWMDKFVIFSLVGRAVYVSGHRHAMEKNGVLSCGVDNLGDRAISLGLKHFVQRQPGWASILERLIEFVRCPHSIDM